jgi:hypothetical protein
VPLPQLTSGLSGDMIVLSSDFPHLDGYSEPMDAPTGENDDKERFVELRNGYSGPFDSDASLGDFSRQTLAHLGREYLLNGHLQDRVEMPLVAKRIGGDAYVQIAIEEWMGASPIYSLRMQRAMGFEDHDVSVVFKNLQFDIGAPHQFMDFQFRLDRPDYGEFWLTHCGALLDVEPFGEEPVKLMCHDIEAVAKVFQVHPCFFPRAYVDFGVELTGAQSARIAIRDCPALEEGDACSWFAGPGAEAHPALDAIAGAVNPRARCHPVQEAKDARLAWDVVIDPSAAPQPVPQELQLAKISRGASFCFEQRRTLRGAC